MMELAPFTPIVGVNNVGKSNVLRALQWFLSPEKPKLDDLNDTTKPVVVSGLIAGVTTANLAAIKDEQHRQRIVEFIVGDKIWLRRTGDPRGSGKAAVKTEVAAGNIDDPATVVWKPVPTGLPEAIAALFPEPIFVQAMHDAAGDVTSSTAKSTIGQLVAAVMEQLRKDHEAQIGEALRSIGDLFGSQGAKRPASLTALDDAATKELSAVFPGIGIRIHVPTPTMDGLFKGATVKAMEGDTQREVWDLGHGAQRSIQIALIRVLAAQAGRVRPGTNTVLIVEEPELYLHPHAIEATKDALMRLSKAGFQIIAVTHSPQFIGEAEVPDTVLLRKHLTDGTMSLGTIRATARQRITENATQAEALFSLSASSQILFADRVVLSEGDTERRLLPFLYQCVHNRPPMSDHVAMVTLQGCTSAKPARDILEAMGIRVRVVCDLDFAFKHAQRLGLIPAGDADIAACQQLVSNIPGVHIDSSTCWPQKKEGHKTAAEAFAALAILPEAVPHVKSIHERLSAAGYWVWSVGAIEQVLGITGKQPAVHRDFRERAAVDWRSITAGHKEVEQMMKWVIA